VPNFRFLFHLAECDRRRSTPVDIKENFIAPIAYQLFTKRAQSSGPENIVLERPLPAHLVPEPVLNPSRITLENNGKTRPQPDRENAFAGANGGGDGPAVEPSPHPKSLI
jgi:hypothetical protein